MEMSFNNGLQAICTVSELARKLDLSRARFYQLQKKGVFPAPMYCIRSRRPFYPLELQQRCVDIRTRGIGCDGQPVIFYRSHKSKSKKSQSQSDSKCDELVTTLRSMGLDVARNDIKKAVKALYPEGLTKGPIEGMVVGEIFRYLSNSGRGAVSNFCKEVVSKRSKDRQVVVKNRDS